MDVISPKDFRILRSDGLHHNLKCLRKWIYSPTLEITKQCPLWMHTDWLHHAICTFMGWRFFTSKQKSCPRILLWSGLTKTFSSVPRSNASTALPGLNKDSCERDSFSFGSPRDLKADKKGKIRGSHLLKKIWKHPETKEDWDWWVNQSVQFL